MLSWIRCLKSPHHEQPTQKSKECHDSFQRASKQFFYSDFQNFREVSKETIQHQFKEVQLLNQDRYSKQVLKRNEQHLQGLLLKVKVSKIGATVSQGLLKTKYRISLAQNHRYVSFRALKRDLIQHRQSICDVDPKLGVNYLKFLFKYFERGFLLECFKNQFLYIQKPDTDSLGRIYIFNEKFFSPRKIYTQKINQPKQMKDLIKDFFMLKQQKNYLSKFRQNKSKIMESKINFNYSIRYSKYQGKDLELIQNILQTLQSYQNLHDLYMHNKNYGQLPSLLQELFHRLSKIIEASQKNSCIAATVENDSQNIIMPEYSDGQYKKSRQLDDDSCTCYENSILSKRRSLDLKLLNLQTQQTKIKMFSQIN